VLRDAFKKLKALCDDLGLEEDVYEESRALAHRYFLKKAERARAANQPVEKIGHYRA